MASSTKFSLKLPLDQFPQTERVAQQQLFGVEKTSCQLLMTVASRLHERLAASVSAKLASFDPTDSQKVRSNQDRRDTAVWSATLSRVLFCCTFRLEFLNRVHSFWHRLHLYHYFMRSLCGVEACSLQL